LKFEPTAEDQWGSTDHKHAFTITREFGADDMRTLEDQIRDEIADEFRKWGLDPEARP